MSENLEKQVRVLAEVLDGCPLDHPCDELWEASREGWCSKHCNEKQLDAPDAECWMRYAEVMANE